MKANINDIQKIYPTIPTSYIVDGKRTDGYHKKTEQHYEDGWRDVVIETLGVNQKHASTYILENDIVVKKAIDMTVEEIEAHEDSLIPIRLTGSQLKQSLIINGYSLDNIEIAIASLPSPQKEIMEVRWQHEGYFNRKSDEVKNIAMAIGMTTENLNTVFSTGESL
jgi:hypothetical protein